MNEKKKIFFETPTLMKFSDLEGEEIYGMGFNDKIICACCGETFEADDVEILTIYRGWPDFSETIVNHLIDLNDCPICPSSDSTCPYFKEGKCTMKEAGAGNPEEECDDYAAYMEEEDD